MDLGIQEEIKFWDGWFRDFGGIYSAEYNRRKDPNLEIETYLQKFINSSQLESFKILDAGAGPVSSLGRKFKGTSLNITAVDPLAEYYQELYAKHNYIPYVKTIKGDFLNLSQQFGENIFDFVYSRNSLDHSADPVKAIHELVKVCKKNQHVFFENAEAEATREKGDGLHQWDFLVTNNNLIVQNYKSKKITNMNEYLKPFVSEMKVILTGDWITVEIKK